MRAIIVALAMVVSGAASAGEGDFPMFPVEDLCRAQTKNDRVGFADCIRAEQFAYDKANFLRSDVPDEDRYACSEMARKSAAMKYTILLTCYQAKIEMAQVRQDQTAARDGRAPKFRY